MINEPTTLILIQHGTRYSITLDHSDMSLDEIMERVIALLLAAGHSPEKLKEYITNENNI